MSEASSSRGPVKNYTIIDSRRGGKTLLHSGHNYHFLRQNKRTVVWQCVNKRSDLKCSGSVTLESENQTIIKENKHSNKCVPSFSNNEVSLAMSECKQEIATNFTSVQKTFEKHMKNLKDKGYHLTGNIPDYKSVKSMFYRHRNKSLKVPKTQFNNPADVIIPEEFHKYVLADYCSKDGNRIIILTSTEIKQHIKDVTHIFGDGTFDGCPAPFTQVYIIHGDMGSTETATNVAPLFYVLLKNKEGETYKKMFELIKDALPEWCPSKCTFDFEMGAINAATVVFHGVEVNGCNIHFQKNVIKKATSLHLMDHEETAKHIKLCMSLAYLPKPDIEDGWLFIMENRYVFLI